MTTAIQVVWWVGLIGALVPTLVILKQVSLIVRTLRSIRLLAAATGVAAKEITGHLAAAPKLEGLGQRVADLNAMVLDVADSLAALAPCLPASGRGADR